MNRKGLIAVSLLGAGCATQAVGTPEQARTIALSSVCAKAQVALDPDEKMLTEWHVERRGDKWHVWLPHGPGTISPTGRALKSAWINARDGTIAYCDGRYR